MKLARRKYAIFLRGYLLLLPVLMLLFLILRKTRLTNKLLAPSDKYYLVLKLLLENGFSIPVARMIAAQFAHETANFSSSLFERANNVSGMKKAVKRDNIQAGETNGYAVYNSVADSVADFALWYQYAGMPFLRFATLDKFVRALKDRSYFTDSYENYYRGVLNFYNLYEGK